MEKKNVLIYVLTIIITIALGVGIGFGVSKLAQNKNEQEVKDNNNQEVINEEETDIKNNEIDENKDNKEKIYSNWSEYILDQDIKDSYIAIWGEEENGEYYSKNININKTELSNIFAEMRKGDLTKHYNTGSGDSTPTLVVKYESNNKEFTLEIPYAREIWVDGLDESIIELIEKENYKTYGTPGSTNSYDVYVYDWDGTSYLNKLIENK